MLGDILAAYVFIAGRGRGLSVPGTEEIERQFRGGAALKSSAAVNRPVAG